MPSASTRESAATAARVLVCARTRRAARASVRLLPVTRLLRATSRRRKHNHTHRHRQSSKRRLIIPFVSIRASSINLSLRRIDDEIRFHRQKRRPNRRVAHHPIHARSPPHRSPPPSATPATRRIQTIRNVHHRKPSRDRPESRRAHHRGRRQMRQPRRSTRSVRRARASIHPAIRPSSLHPRRETTVNETRKRKKGAFYVPASVVVVDVLVCCASILIYPPAGVGRLSMPQSTVAQSQFGVSSIRGGARRATRSVQ